MNVTQRYQNSFKKCELVFKISINNHSLSETFMYIFQTLMRRLFMQPTSCNGHMPLRLKCCLTSHWYVM